MALTKEKVVFAVATIVALASFRSARMPAVEPAPRVQDEEAPRLPRVTVPVPVIRPDKPLVAGARDPFVPASAWAAATPALLGLPPEPQVPRLLPGGSPPGVRARGVSVPADPKPLEEPETPAAPGGGK